MFKMKGLGWGRGWGVTHLGLSPKKHFLYAIHELAMCSESHPFQSMSKKQTDRFI